MKKHLMKKMLWKCIFCVCLAAGWVSQLQAQKSLPLSVSYYGHFALQPGLKVGMDFQLKSWEKQGQRTKERQLFLRPQVSAFVNPGLLGVVARHSNVVLNLDLGYRSQAADGNWYYGAAVGLGLLGRSVVLTEVWSLGGGGLLSSDREFTAYMLPTVNFEFGRSLSERTAIFSRITYGASLNPQRESTAMPFFELGLTIDLKGVSHE